MLHIDSLLINVHHSDAELIKKISKLIGCKCSDIKSFEIRKRSIDARKKPKIFYSYSLDVNVRNESVYLKRNKSITEAKPVRYAFEAVDDEYNRFCSESAKQGGRPVIVGFGPAGIFCALLLARSGLSPVVIERGESVFDRELTVQKFWNEGILDAESNISFGEGGAGTFSDGKLNTLVKDTAGRNAFVLKTLVRFGAPEEIMYDSRPHIGTDLLTGVVKNIREEIKRLGGEVRFNSKLTGIGNINETVKKVYVRNTKTGYESCIAAKDIVLALGHSARDSFYMLYDLGLAMEPKSFAIGIRVAHSQNLIDISQYGNREAKFLSPAPYKLSFKSKCGRGVYSFCMCPGGFIVNASTESQKIAVNGMSYHKRNSGSANSAIIVSVDSKDFKEYSDETKVPLTGIDFQRKLEEEAYRLGKGKIPIQRLTDFLNGVETTVIDTSNLAVKGEVSVARVDKLLPREVYASIKEAFADFDRKIRGFVSDEAYVAAIESRTSSPVRILRDEKLSSNIAGIYPSGEGAGYAGGIMSAAMDGLKVAEKIITKYQERA